MRSRLLIPTYLLKLKIKTKHVYLSIYGRNTKRYRGISNTVPLV